MRFAWVLVVAALATAACNQRYEKQEESKIGADSAVVSVPEAKDSATMPGSFQDSLPHSSHAAGDTARHGAATRGPKPTSTPRP